MEQVNQDLATANRANMTVNRVCLAELMPIPKEHNSYWKSRVLTDPEDMAQLQTDYLKKENEMKKEKSMKTRAAKPCFSNKANIPENGQVVAGKRNVNAVHEKDPLAAQNRQP